MVLVWFGVFPWSALLSCDYRAVPADYMRYPQGSILTESISSGPELIFSRVALVCKKKKKKKKMF